MKSLDAVQDILARLVNNQSFDQQELSNLIEVCHSNIVNSNTLQGQYEQVNLLGVLFEKMREIHGNTIPLQEMHDLFGHFFSVFQSTLFKLQVFHFS